MNAFLRQDRERSIEAFAARLASLPRVNGQSDINGLGDPAELAKQWAAEMKLSPEDRLDRLLKHFEENKN
jgi:hypothetical protein